MVSKRVSDAYLVFFLQKPTLLIASAILLSSDDIIASTDILPPNAALRFVAAAYMTSSLVCDDNISATRVA